MTADTDEGVEGRERTTDEVVRETRLNFLRQRADHHRKMAGMMKQPFKGDHEELAGAFDEAARRLRNRESWEVLARLVESGREPSFYVGATGHGEKLACLGLVDPAEELTEPLDSDSPWTTLLRTALTQDRGDEEDE